MDNITFYRISEDRKEFLRVNSGYDHVLIPGFNRILLSCPHAVSQVRLGKAKVAEIGTLNTGLYLKNNTDCYLISKTKNNFDDANFDDVSSYKDDIYKLIEMGKIKYVIDLHGLARTRPMDINLGTNIGNNISSNVALFDKLLAMLEKAHFNVSIDQPFMAGVKTVSGAVKHRFDDKVWTLQIEINSSITNDPKNFKKFRQLLDVLTEWLLFIENN